MAEPQRTQSSTWSALQLFTCSHPHGARGIDCPLGDTSGGAEEVAWVHVGDGRGAYQEVKTFEFVGQGSGAYNYNPPQARARLTPLPPAQACAICALSILMTAGFMVLVNSLKHPRESSGGKWLGMPHPSDCFTGDSVDREYCCKKYAIACPGNASLSTTDAPAYDCNSSDASTWPERKQLFCCGEANASCVLTTTTTTSSASYQCDKEVDNWGLWAEEKKRWCCTNTGHPCLGNVPPYTCVRNSSSSKTWSLDQQAWCCRYQGLCPRFDCNSGYLDWQRRWSLNKQAWCCKHAHRACGTTTTTTTRAALSTKVGLRFFPRSPPSNATANLEPPSSPARSSPPRPPSGALGEPSAAAADATASNSSAGWGLSAAATSLTLGGS